jgi:beta-N-acetylhexosaminidase
MGMTCHCVFTAWDSERPASQSPKVIGDVIRGRIGFDGFLMSDDIGMQALGGGFDQRTRGVIEAGTDAVLHCSGLMDEMVAVAGAAGELSEEGRERLDRAMASVAGARDALAYEALAEKRDRLLALA